MSRFPTPFSAPGSSSPVHSTVTHIIVIPQDILYWKAHTPHTWFPTPFFSSRFFSSCSHYSDTHHCHTSHCSETHTPLASISHIFFNSRFSCSQYTHCTERHTHPTPRFPTPFLSSTFFSSCSQYSDPHLCQASTHTVLKGTYTLCLNFPHPSSVPGSSPVHITVNPVIVTLEHTLYWKAHTPFASISHTHPQFHVLLLLFTVQWPTSLSRFNTHCTERHTHPSPQYPTSFLSSRFFCSCSHYSDPRHCHTPHASISHTLPQLHIFLLLFTLQWPTSSAHNMHWKAHPHPVPTLPTRTTSDRNLPVSEANILYIQ